jgi:ABC-2 type transport system permease protein
MEQVCGELALAEVEHKVNIFRKTGSYLRLASAYFSFNLRSQMEYRTAFISQALAMFINNSVWLAFWTLFFARFPALGGWTLTDLATMWAVASSGFGLGHSICGNSVFLPTMITKGQLDAWMLYPRALLGHFILGKMSATSFGDALFGFVIYGLFARPDPTHFVLFSVMVVSVAFIFIAFDIITGSVGFYIGNAERLSEECRWALVTFSTYPETLFDGNVRIFLYLVIPAGFATYLPVTALRTLSLSHAFYALAGSVVFVLVAIWVFYRGLERYESGNLIEMRG